MTVGEWFTVACFVALLAAAALCLVSATLYLRRLAEATERTALVLETSHAAELRGLKPKFNAAKAEDVAAWREENGVETPDDGQDLDGLDFVPTVGHVAASPQSVSRGTWRDPLTGVLYVEVDGQWVPSQTETGAV